MFRTLIAIVSLFTFLPIFAQQAEITTSELFEIISFLASDSLKGRKPGTKEDSVAAHYIKNQISYPRIEFLAENGFQTFDIVSSIELGICNKFVCGDSVLQLETDYIPSSFSDNDSLTARLVFAGYGFNINTDSLFWEDYQSIDVKNKWVLLLRGDPEMENPDSEFAPFSPLRKKCLVAKDFGAAGVLFVSGKKFDEEDTLPKLQIEESHITAGMPVVHITRHCANLLLKSSMLTIDSLESLLNDSRQPQSFETDGQISATIDIKRVTKPTCNVVALLKGSEKKLDDDYIVIGAHYDHLGYGGPGSGSRRPDTTAIHNGADDNASGVAGLIEIFEKCAAHYKKIKKSIIFVAFAAEEMGTLGSSYFLNSPVVDVNKIKFMVNLDMIGRLDSLKSITIYGSGTAVGLEEKIREIAQKYPFDITFSPEGLGPSDHAPFYAHDIPVIMFFTGTHDDYHTPEDDVDKINFEGEKKIADFIYDVIVDIANQDKPLVFQEAGPKERYGSRRRFKVTLGLMPDVAGVEKRGMRVDAVTPGRPANRAGMKKGDIIIAIDGKKVANVYDYMHRLAECKQGQRISVEILRNEEKVILIVEL